MGEESGCGGGAVVPVFAEEGEAWDDGSLQAGVRDVDVGAGIAVEGVDLVGAVVGAVAGGAAEAAVDGGLSGDGLQAGFVEGGLEGAGESGFREGGFGVGLGEFVGEAAVDEIGERGEGASLSHLFDDFLGQKVDFGGGEGAGSGIGSGEFSGGLAIGRGVEGAVAVVGLEGAGEDGLCGADGGGVDFKTEVRAKEGFPGFFRGGVDVEGAVVEEVGRAAGESGVGSGEGVVVGAG